MKFKNGAKLTQHFNAHGLHDTNGHPCVDWYMRNGGSAVNFDEAAYMADANTVINTGYQCANTVGQYVGDKNYYLMENNGGWHPFVGTKDGFITTYHFKQLHQIDSRLVATKVPPTVKAPVLSSKNPFAALFDDENS